MGGQAISLNALLDVFLYGRDVLEGTRVQQVEPLEMGCSYTYAPARKTYTVLSVWKRDLHSSPYLPASSACSVCHKTFATSSARKIHATMAHKQPRNH